MDFIEKETILKLITLKHELGGYWDFKREWHANKADLLHDIICMANNLESRDGYIILGVDEENDYAVCGINDDPNRKNTQNIIDFLRDKKFAGGIRPTVRVETIDHDAIEIDVLIMQFDRYSPYYLTEKHDGVFANNIYTRVQDTNTPKDRSADIHHIEMLWKRRFGLDVGIHERFFILLDQYDQWECDFGNTNTAFHRVFPEFKIQVQYDFDNSEHRWEPQSAYYLNSEMGFRWIQLLYFNTVIFEWGIMDFDGAKVILPFPKDSSLGIKVCDDVCYSYYDLTALEGKLLKLMTSGTMSYHSRHLYTDVHLFLIFNGEEERKRFNEFAVHHYDEIDLDALNERCSLAFIQNQKSEHVNSSAKQRILDVAIASELYKGWRLTLEEGK